MLYPSYRIKLPWLLVMLVSRAGLAQLQKVCAGSSVRLLKLLLWWACGGPFDPLAAGVWHLGELRGLPRQARDPAGSPWELVGGGGGSPSTHQHPAQLLKLVLCPELWLELIPITYWSGKKDIFLFVCFFFFLSRPKIPFGR